MLTEEPLENESSDNSLENQEEKNDGQESLSDTDEQTLEIEEQSSKNEKEEQAPKVTDLEEIHRKAIMYLDSNLVSLAKRAKMDSYLKIQIFCIIMSEEVNFMFYVF